MNKNADRKQKEDSKRKVHGFALIKMELHLKFNYSIMARKRVSVQCGLKEKKYKMN